jgi:hypothetical protein
MRTCPVGRTVLARFLLCGSRDASRAAEAGYGFDRVLHGLALIVKNRAGAQYCTPIDPRARRPVRRASRADSPASCQPTDRPAIS